jgi:RimJ/RimL family protein N-acetyltransferase
MTVDVVHQVSIQAERFILRPVQETDLGLLQLYGGDRRVAENTTSIAHPLPPGATEAFIARSTAANRSEDVWVMDGSGHNLSGVLGCIALKRMDNNQSELGYWVAPALWNGGFASEAVHALLGANPQNNRSIFAQVFQDNPGSARVLTNAGFDYIGDAEAYCVARGHTVPTWTYIKNLNQ